MTTPRVEVEFPRDFAALARDILPSDILLIYDPSALRAYQATQAQVIQGVMSQVTELAILNAILATRTAADRGKVLRISTSDQNVLVFEDLTTGASYTLTADAVLDLIAQTRTPTDRGMAIGVSPTDENGLAFLSIPPAQVQSDWDATTGLGAILNKPTIPPGQVQSDWDATTGLGAILNKPAIPPAFSPTQANIYAAVAAILGEGANVTLTENAATNTITIAAATTGSSYTLTVDEFLDLISQARTTADRGKAIAVGDDNENVLQFKAIPVVSSWAQEGNNDPFPLDKVDGAQSATQAPMRIRWSGTQAGLNAARFNTGQESIGNTRDGVAAPQSSAQNEFLGIWIGTAEANIADIDESGISVLGDLFPNIAAGEPLTVAGTAGTVYRTHTAVSVALWEGQIFRATLSPEHFGDVVDARIRDYLAASNLSEVFDGAEYTGDTLTLRRRDNANPVAIDLSGLRVALSDAAPVNTPGTPSAGTSSEAAHGDHDHGIPPADGVADAVDVALSGTTLSVTVGRSGTLGDLADSEDLSSIAGLDQTAVDARVQAAKGTNVPGNTPGTPSPGTSDDWAPDDHDHGINPGAGGQADGVANSVNLSLNGNALELTVGRSGVLSDLTDTEDLSGLRTGLATEAELSTHEAEITGQGHVTSTERAKLDALSTSRQLPATTPGQNVGQVAKVQQDGSYALADDEQGTGGGTADGVADAVNVALSGTTLAVTIGRSGTLADLSDSQDLAGLRSGLATGADLTAHEADVSGQGHVTSAERDKLTALATGRQLPATTPGQNVGQVAKVQQDGSYALADDEQASGGAADGVANSVDLSLSGNTLSLTVGRSGTLGDLTDTQDLSSISGTSELPRWHHVAAESQFTSLRTAGLDRLVADRDLTITAVNTITDPGGTQITEVKNGDLFIWNEQTTPNRWERFGNINTDGLLDQAAVDARIAALVADWAEAGNSDVFPLAKVDGAQAATQAEMRIRWSGTQAGLNATHFNTGQDGRGNTRDGAIAPLPVALTEFFGIWIGTAEANITDIEESGVSVLGTLFANIAAGEPLTVDGTAGTVYRTAAAVSGALWEGRRFRATLNPLHFGDVVDARIRDDVVHWALDGDTTIIPTNKLPTATGDGVADSVDLAVSGNDLTLTVGRSGALADLTDTVTLPGSAGVPIVRSRVGHLDSVTINTASVRLISLTEDIATHNDYQVEITDDVSGMSIASPMMSGEFIRSKANLAANPTNYVNALLASFLTTRFLNATALTDNSVSRWNILKGTSNSQLNVVNVNGAGRATTIEVWKYPRTGQKGDKGDPGDPGEPGAPGSGSVTFGSAAGDVATWAEGNSTEDIPFGKIEVGEAQGTVAVRLGWSNQQNLAGVGVQIGTTGSALTIPVSPADADRIWVAVRVDNASDVTQINVGGYNQLGSSGYFNQAGVELTFNGETWFRFLTRVLDSLEQDVLDDRQVTVRITPDNLDEHIDRRAEEEIRRYREELPVIEDITLSDSEFGTRNSAGDTVNLTWPDAVLNQLPAPPDHVTTAKQYSLNVPATSGDPTWTEADSGGGEVALDDLRALRDTGRVLPYSANVTLLGSSPTVDNRENINDGDLTTFATFNGSTKTAVVCDWGRVVRRPRIHVWANGVSSFSFRGVNANGHDAGALFNVSTVNGKTVWDAGERDLRGMFLQQAGGSASVNIFLIYVEDTRLTEVTYDAPTRQLLGLNLALPEATTSAAGLLSAADKTTYDGYQAQIDALGVDPTTTVGGDLLNVIAERIAVHTTMTLGQVAPSNLELGFSRVTPIVGSFDPAIPTNDLTNLVKVFMSRENNVDNRPPGGTINIQFRLFLEVTEATATRSYEGKRVVWGPTGTSPALEEHTWTWGWHSQGRNTYYTDVVTHRPTAGGQTVTFNLEDVVAETYETFPGTPWIWHATIATVQEHISNAAFTAANASTTEVPTQHAVAEYVSANAGGGVSARLFYLNGQTARFNNNLTGASALPIVNSGAGGFSRIVFDTTSREEYGSPSFVVDWQTSAEAEASDLDQVGAETLPANHAFELETEGTYNIFIELRTRGTVNQRGTHGRAMAFLTRATSGRDELLAVDRPSVSGGNTPSSVSLFDSTAQFMASYHVDAHAVTVPSTGSTFVVVLATGDYTQAVDGYMVIEKVA